MREEKPGMREKPSQDRDKSEDLITDLVYLRKGAGFTAGRIYSADAFMSVIGGKNQIFENIKIRFISAIRSLAEKQNAEALLAAYALLPEYASLPDLKSRRAKYGLIAKRKYDTIADRESAAIGELAVRLLAAYYSGAPLPAELPVPHGGYLLSSLRVDTRIRDRRFISHEQVRVIVSLVAGAKGFEYHSSEKSRLIPIAGLRVKTRHVTHGAIHTCLYPKPLKRGQTYRFSFREESDEAPELGQNEDFAGQSFETPALSYRQTVIFEGEKPQVVWFYKNLSRIERPGEPEDGNLLEPDGGGGVLAGFSQLYGGLHSGIAWRWEK